MRTNIDIDDTLLAQAMGITGLTSKKATVEEALRQIVDMYHRRKAMEAAKGIGWEGDLDAMRDGRDW